MPKAGSESWEDNSKNGILHSIGDKRKAHTGSARYTDKSLTLTAASVITAETIPPSCNAADLHFLRAYLQVRQWLGNDRDLTGSGFHISRL